MLTLPRHLAGMQARPCHLARECCIVGRKLSQVQFASDSGFLFQMKNGSAVAKCGPVLIVSSAPEPLRFISHAITSHLVKHSLGRVAPPVITEQIRPQQWLIKQLRDGQPPNFFFCCKRTQALASLGLQRAVCRPSRKLSEMWDDT